MPLMNKVSDGTNQIVNRKLAIQKLDFVAEKVRHGFI